MSKKIKIKKPQTIAGSDFCCIFTMTKKKYTMANLQQFPNEIWVGVKGFENEYQVSNLGRLRSLDRYTGPYFFKGRIIKTKKKKHGYVSLELHKDSRDYSYNMHRLVAVAFIPNPENKEWVNHKNGVTDDNRVVNLEWSTISENHLHAYKELGRKNPACKSVIMVDRYGRELKRFENESIAANETGLDQTTISDHVRGKIKLSRKGFTFIAATTS